MCTNQRVTVTPKATTLARQDHMGAALAASTTAAQPLFQLAIAQVDRLNFNDGAKLIIDSEIVRYIPTND
jgi:hypothetical protein